MPSKKPQINVRADEETVERLSRLVVAVGAALNVSVSQADVVRLALIEFEKKYAAEPGKGPAKGIKRPRSRGTP